MSPFALRIENMRVTGLARRDQLPELLRQLESADLPNPEELVLIRHLPIQSRLSHFSTALAHGVRDMLASAQRVSCEAPAPETSRAVRFADEVERVAALSHDLASGVATSRWYFREALRELGADRPGAAIARLWARRPLDLPSVCARLLRAQRLASTWATLHDQDVREVMAALVREGALAASALERDAHVPEEAPDEVVVSPYRLAEWRRLVRLDVMSQERARLAAIVLLLEAAPLHLAANPARTRRAVAAVVRALLEPGGERSSYGVAAAPGDGATLPAGTQVRTRAAARLEPRPQGPGDQRVGALGAEASAPSRSEPSEAGPALGEAFDAFSGLTVATDYGGALFLVNAFQHPRLRKLVSELGVFVGRPHGWAFWRAIALDLGLPPGDGLAQWFEKVLAELPDPVPPPEPPLRAAFHAAARDLYGPELWAPSLLPCSGTLRATQSHLDLYVPLAAVRIELRMVGLDLNPAWVPWLGRVVTIHYRGGTERP